MVGSRARAFSHKGELVMVEKLSHRLQEAYAFADVRKFTECCAEVNALEKVLEDFSLLKKFMGPVGYATFFKALKEANNEEEVKHDGL